MKSVFSTAPPLECPRDYALWASHVLSRLDSLGVAEILQDSDVAAENSQLEESKADFALRNERARGTIIHALPVEYHACVQKISMARDIWKKIKKSFSFDVNDLEYSSELARRNFLELKMTPQESIHSFLLRFEGALDAYKEALNGALTDAQASHFLIEKLNSSYDGVKLILLVNLSSSDSHSSFVEVVKKADLFKARQLQETSKVGSCTSNANIGSTRRESSESNPHNVNVSKQQRNYKCVICRRDNHNTQTCRRLPNVLESVGMTMPRNFR